MARSWPRRAGPDCVCPFPPAPEPACFHAENSRGPVRAVIASAAGHPPKARRCIPSNPMGALTVSPGRHVQDIEQSGLKTPLSCLMTGTVTPAACAALAAGKGARNSSRGTG
jgi:hypothetical protein